MSTALDDVIRRAYHIAVRDLRACYNPDGIVAGRLHFNAYWARDGFCASFEPAMDRAIAWLMSQDRDGDGLIENRHFLADWMDSILKKDKDFYLNLLFFEGLRAGRAVKEWLGHADDARRYEELAASTGRALQRVFWNGQYFTDWVRGSRHGGVCSARQVPALPLWGGGVGPGGAVPPVLPGPGGG